MSFQLNRVFERFITVATHKRISFIMNIRICLEIQKKSKLFLTEDTIRDLSLPGLHADGKMLFQIEFIPKLKSQVPHLI